jgi:hypothetical protein
MGRILALFLGSVVAIAFSVSTHATDRKAIAIEGTYLIKQDDGYQRLLTFDRGGNLSQVSDQQTLLGFTAGRGTWQASGSNGAIARVIDFSFNLKTGARVGPSMIVYELTFSDPALDGFQSVGGSLNGKIFPVGEDPLQPTKDPIQSFKIGLSGRRVQ